MEYDVLMADGNAAANAGRQITDVIFDFGNVLIYWDPAAVMTPRYSDGLVEQFKAAQEAHFDLIPAERTIDSRRLSTEYLRYFLGYIYDHFDAFKLLLCCSAGTRYENYIHDLVELEVSQTEHYYAELEQRGKIEGHISHELHHLITSAYFTAVFETVVHDMNRERAMSYIEELATFFNCGWDGLLRLK